ncbi:Uncharacterized protein Fot_11210 [Forsythia ovata]|uniref:Uncharacterized protein n=1 Tax=Forsythia ovata TaxID=205694 RepID=A0ABD1WMS9_9LAMI
MKQKYAYEAKTEEEKLEVYASKLFEKNKGSIELNAHFADPPQSNPTGIDLDTTAPDVELDDMEFTDHDLKMIDETMHMKNMSTSKKTEKIGEDDDIIQIDDITPSAPRTRIRKTECTNILISQTSYHQEIVNMLFKR